MVNFFAFNVFQESQSEEKLNKSGEKHSDSFEKWVTHGEMLYVWDLVIWPYPKDEEFHDFDVQKNKW